MGEAVLGISDRKKKKNERKIDTSPALGNKTIDITRSVRVQVKTGNGTNLLGALSDVVLGICQSSRVKYEGT